MIILIMLIRFAFFTCKACDLIAWSIYSCVIFSYVEHNALFFMLSHDLFIYVSILICCMWVIFFFYIILLHWLCIIAYVVHVLLYLTSYFIYSFIKLIGKVSDFDFHSSNHDPFIPMLFYYRAYFHVGILLVGFRILFFTCELLYS